jgi:hypothetical protein
MNPTDRDANGPLLPQQGRVPVVKSTGPSGDLATRTVATRDPDVIRRWADARQARPATGQQTATGPSSAVSVHDGGAGIRFNFPGVSPFREITWEEWLEHLSEHDLLFVFEEQTPAGPPSNRYRLVRARVWDGPFDVSAETP